MSKIYNNPVQVLSDEDLIRTLEDKVADYDEIIEQIDNELLDLRERTETALTLTAGHNKDGKRNNEIEDYQAFIDSIEEIRADITRALGKAGL